MTDGRGNVRIMAHDAARQWQRLTGRRSDYSYRTPGSRDWMALWRLRRRSTEGIDPLAIDAEHQCRLRAQEAQRPPRAVPHHARRQLAARALVASIPQVDIDGVVRIGRGQRVIGYTYADESTRSRLFRPGVQEAGGVAGQGAAEPAADRLRRRQRRRHEAADLRRQRHAIPGAIIVFDQDDQEARARSCWSRPSSRDGARDRSSRSPIRPPTGRRFPAYLTLPAGQRRQEPAGDRPAAWRPERARRMGLRLARPIPRRARLCGDPAQFRGSAGYGDEWLQKNGFQAGGPRSATSTRRRAGWSRRHCRSRASWRSSAGPMAAMRRCSRRRSSPTCSRRSSRSRR